jgi:hypothetical protein
MAQGAVLGSVELWIALEQLGRVVPRPLQHLLIASKIGNCQQGRTRLPCA